MSRAPLYALADYVNAFLQLLPSGAAWAKETGSNMVQSITALLPTYVRSNQAAIDLLQDAFPSSAVNLLPEWESSLGLPDSCQGPSPTILSRQAQVVARFAGSGSLSVPFMIAYAANLGFDISITEYSPFCVGLSGVGAPLADSGAAFLYAVNCTSYDDHLFEVGISGVGEPLGSAVNAVLECEMRRIAPAFCTLIFSYRTSALGSFVLGSSVLG
jgi:uncharacterized protein YmfQ (DUF2313 family)